MNKRDYRDKIKSVEEIAAVIGRPPRDKSVIMCHGVFDIVHPGHLRHLHYAKEKADFLIASVTADVHIAKANMRPFVPQELRAANLAALEMVDFVVIDPNPTPIENIKRLQPDYFAKGYEYFANGVPPKTQEELDTLAAYGGEVVFTPGDVVYSSSALIEANPPKIGVEKLLALMDSEGLDFDKLQATLRRLDGLRVHVVGDTILDLYSYCTVLGATSKSPTFSVRHDSTERFTGGAAVVAQHMRAAGAEVTFTTVLGEDDAKDFVLEDLTKAGIHCRPFIDRSRPTTQKERFIADGYKMLQVDRVDNRRISDRTIEFMRQGLQETSADVVVFSDFRHGIFNRETIPAMKAAIPDGVLTAADSQVSNRWGNILDFADMDLLTPNEREARFALGDQDSVIRPLASELYRRARCKFLVLKMGERGVLCHRSSGPLPREFFSIDSFVDHVVDPIGAGDAFLAYCVLSLAATRDFVTAAILGAMGAALACEHSGNTPVRPRDVGGKLTDVEQRARYAVGR